MFICEPCLSEFEGPAVDAVRIMGVLVRLSRGPCEVCHIVGDCHDIWSGADFQRKQAPVPSVIDSFRGEWAFLSNFHVESDGKTVEHFFQAAKSNNAAERRAIIDADSAGAAKRMGRRVQLREDWEDAKDEVMFDLVYQKFSTDPDLKANLMRTGDVQLIEGNTWGDTYWGVCHGMGLNKLGQILMQVRDQLKLS